jgi:hypothetical protein
MFVEQRDFPGPQFKASGACGTGSGQHMLYFPCRNPLKKYTNSDRSRTGCWSANRYTSSGIAGLDFLWNVAPQSDRL